MAIKMKVVKQEDRPAQDQRNFFLKELNTMHFRYRDELPLPPAVRRAKRIVDRYQAKIRAEQNREHARFKKLCQKMRTAIYLGTLKDCETALRKLQEAVGSK